MKFKIITMKENYEEWLKLDVCDDCGVVNSEEYFKIYTTHNKKEILLCKSCVKNIFTRGHK